MREHIEAFNGGDLERLLAGFAEDALCITGQTGVRGRQPGARRGDHGGGAPTATSWPGCQSRIASELDLRDVGQVCASPSP